MQRVFGRFRPRTWLIIGGALALVIAGGTTAALALGNQRQAQTSTTQTVAASLETFETTIEASGTLSPSVQESVSFTVSGTVTSVSVAAGDTVAAGATLATVDTLTLNADLLSARADLADAQAQLASAQSSSDGTASAVAQIAARSAAVDVAQAAVTEAEAAMAEATLTSPVSGLVTAVSLDVGDAVSGSGSSSGSGSQGSSSGSGATSAQSSASSSTTTSQFTIVGTDAWQVSVSLGETEIGEIEVGNEVELETSDGAALSGVVETIGVLPSTSSGSSVYPVTIAITDSGDSTDSDDDTSDADGAAASEGTESLFDGVSVTATIVTERRTDVLAVPASAVTRGADGASTVTLVDSSGAERSVEVETGETSGTLVEIVSGLSEGDLVLVTVFTPGAEGDGDIDTRQTEGNSGFPSDGQMPEGGQFPEGGQMPEGGSGGGQMPGGGAPGNE